MEWGINDSLKARSYGQKKDYDEKLDKVSHGSGKYKQYYPVGADGNIDEWSALSKQQQELAKKAQQEEHMNQQQQKKQYYSTLDRQRYEKIQEKLADDQMKQREMLEMKQREQELAKVADLEKEQRQKYLEYMNNNYKTSLEYKREKQKEEKEAQLEEERERLKRIERDLKEEQKRNTKKKATFMQEAQEVATHKRMLKEMEQQRKNNEKNEYQQLAQKNYQMEVAREDNYKRFFKDYDTHMSERINNHMKFVTEPTISKQQMLDEIEDKNEKEYQEWQDDKERREKEERMKHLKDMHEENKKVFDKLDREKTQKKEMYQKMVEQRRKEEDDYKDQQRKQMEDEEERRRLYREALEYQKGFKEYNKKHLGQMTQMEKKLNSHDLKTFKNKKMEYEGMIPGIHNIQSVGSKPILRKANDDMYDQTKNSPSFMTKELNKSYKDLRSSIKPLTDFSKTNSPEKKDRYDPITNPVPFINQNPYISKEKSVIGGAGASSMLLGSNRGSRRSLLSSTAEKNILI